MLGRGCLDQQAEVGVVKRHVLFQKLSGNFNLALGEIAQQAPGRFAGMFQARRTDDPLFIRRMKQHVEQDIARHRPVLWGRNRCRQRHIVDKPTQQRIARTTDPWRLIENGCL